MAARSITTLPSAVHPTGAGPIGDARVVCRGRQREQGDLDLSRSALQQSTSECVAQARVGQENHGPAIYSLIEERSCVPRF